MLDLRGYPVFFVTARINISDAISSNDSTGICLNAFVLVDHFILACMDSKILLPSINQATRHARRVYVGGLPPMANEQVYSSYNYFAWLLVFCSNLIQNVMHLYFLSIEQKLLLVSA